MAVNKYTPRCVCGLVCVLLFLIIALTHSLTSAEPASNLASRVNDGDTECYQQQCTSKKTPNDGDTPTKSVKPTVHENAKPSLVKGIPAILDFQERWVCTAGHKQLTLRSASTTPLQILRINVDSPHFHVFEKDQVPVSPDTAYGREGHTTKEKGRLKEDSQSTKEKGRSTKDEGRSTTGEGHSTKKEGRSTKEDQAARATKEEGRPTKEDLAANAARATRAEARSTKDEARSTKEELAANAARATKGEGRSTKDEAHSTKEDLAANAARATKGEGRPAKEGHSTKEDLAANAARATKGEGRSAKKACSTTEEGPKWTATLGAMEVDVELEVVFVPRMLGLLEADIVVDTNLGKFTYQVKGYGIPNPYKVKAMTGMKVQYGSSHQTDVVVYNPRTHAIQVNKVITSGGFLHLLKSPNPTFSSEVPSQQVEPHTNKTIVTLNYELASAGKYQGFVELDIEDAALATGKEAMIIYIEVTVVQNEIHVQGDEIDFGVLTSPGFISSTPLVILNAGSVPVKVLDITPALPNNMLKIERRAQIVNPGMSTTIAMLEYSGKNSTSVNGKIAIHTTYLSGTYESDNNEEEGSSSITTLNYKAHVVHGELRYSAGNTTFAIGAAPFSKIRKLLTVKNSFPVPLALYAIEIEDTRFVAKMSNFSFGVVALPGKSWPTINISFKANETSMLYTRVHLTTNLTSLYIPLQAYTGAISCSLPAYGNCKCPFVPAPPNSRPASLNQPTIRAIDFGAENCPTSLDFGVFSVDESRNITISFSNTNPIAVPLIDFYTTDNSTAIRLHSLVDASGKFSYNSKVDTTKRKKPLMMMSPGQTANFNVIVHTTREEQGRGDVFLQTHMQTQPQVHALILEKMPVHFRSVEGHIEFSPLTIVFHFPPSRGNFLVPHVSIFALNTCRKPAQILSVSASSPLFVSSLQQLNHSIPPNMSALSANPIIIVYFNDSAIAHDMEISRTQPHTSTLTIHTDLLGYFHIPMEVFISFLPKFLDFGIVMVGQEAAQMVPFYNPSSQDLRVTLKLVAPDDDELENMQERIHFSLADMSEDILVPSHASVLLGPVVFTPRKVVLSATKSVVSLLALSKTEIIASSEIRGEGGSGKLLFLCGEEVQSQLLFELDPDSCKMPPHPSTSDLALPPFGNSLLQTPREKHSFEIFRTVEIVNIGNMVVNIDHIGLNGKACVAHGFHVHNCTSQLSIHVGQRRSIFLSFLPDFSASQVQRELHLFTSQGLVVLPVIAKFGSDQLALCNEHQSIEHNQLLRLSALGLLCVIFILLSMMLLREYCSSSEFLSQIPDLRSENSALSCTNQPLPSLPEIEPPPSLETIEKLSKLTYDGFRPNNNNNKRHQMSRGGAPGTKSTTDQSTESPISTSPPPPQPYIPIPPPTQPGYPSYSTAYSSLSPPNFHTSNALLPDPSHHGLLQLHRLSPPHFIPIQAQYYPIQPPFTMRPPSPYATSFVHKPAVIRPLLPDVGGSSNTPSLSPSVSPVLSGTASKSNERKRKVGEKSAQRATSPAHETQKPAQHDTSPAQDGILLATPKPPPLPSGTFSHSAHELDRKRESLTLRSHSDSALLNEGILVHTMKNPVQQRTRFQQRQPLLPLQPPLNPQLNPHLPQLNPQLNPHLQQGFTKPLSPAPIPLPQPEQKEDPPKTQPKQAKQNNKVQPQQTTQIAETQIPQSSQTASQAATQPTAQPMQAAQKTAQTSTPMTQATQASRATQVQQTQAAQTTQVSQSAQSPQTAQSTQSVQSNQPVHSTQTALQATTHSAQTGQTETAQSQTAHAQPSLQTQPDAQSTAPSNNSIELKKRGIHRRDLVKGSTALPPNMAFVPKKRPTPFPSPPPKSSSPPPASPSSSPPPFASLPRRSPSLPQHVGNISSPLSPLTRRQSTDAIPTFRILTREKQEPRENLVISENSPFFNTPASVMSLGGVSLRGMSTQRKEAIGVIGSGKNSTPSHPPAHTPPPSTHIPPPPTTPHTSPLPNISPQPTPSRSLVGDMFSQANLFPHDSFSFLADPDASPSSLFSDRSPLHVSSPLPCSSHSSPLHNSAPLPNSTYDLFAPSPNPLFAPPSTPLFTNPLFSPNIFDSQHPPPDPPSPFSQTNFSP